MTEDAAAEELLRPGSLEQFIGQATHLRRIEIAASAARDRHEPMDHLLLSGPPGLGKTTLAHIVAREMGAKMVSTSGPALEKMADLAGILTDLDANDVFFVDEIHALRPEIREYLYPAMEDFVIDFVCGEGDAAQAVRMPIQPFTLIGATTRKGRMAQPLRERFGFNVDLSLYDVEDMAAIVLRSARVLKLDIRDAAAGELARRARGTPRVANRLLRRVRDYAHVLGVSPIDEAVVDAAMQLEGVDTLGLDELDRIYLMTLMVQYQGGPTGPTALAATMQQELDTIVLTIEPFLLHEGFILRTPAGRRASPLAYAHLMGADK